MEDMAAAGPSAESKALQGLAERLRTRYQLPPDMIDAEISLALSHFTGGAIRDFVPILVERDVVEHIRQMQRDGMMPAAPAPGQG
jgi:hypothetical protein